MDVIPLIGGLAGLAGVVSLLVLIALRSRKKWKTYATKYAESKVALAVFVGGLLILAPVLALVADAEMAPFMFISAIMTLCFTAAGYRLWKRPERA